MKRKRSRSRSRVRKRFRFRRRKYNWRRRQLVLGGFPKSKTVKLRCCISVTHNPGAGGVAVTAIRANDIYNPEGGVISGESCSNFNKWTGIYDHWVVLGSKFSAQYVPSLLNTQAPAIAGCLLSDNGNGVVSCGDILTLMEQPFNRRGYQLTVGRDIANPLTRIRHKFSARKFFGRPRSALLGDDQLKGGHSSSPTEKAYYELYTYSIHDNDPGEMVYLVTIDYIVRFFEPKLASGN